MGLVDDKKGIINQIGVFTSMGKRVELPDTNTTLLSLNNKNEPVPFMLDMLTVMVGSQALERTTGQVMTDYVRKSEPQLKTSLNKQTVTHNSDKPLSTGFASGYNIPMKSIDIHGKLKTDPSSSTGDVIYGDNANNFDKSIYNAVQNPGTDVTNASTGVILNYDSSNDMIKVRPVTSGQTIGSFTQSFIAGLTIINEKEFTSKLIDAIFGTVSANQNKNLTQLKSEVMFTTTLNKITEGSDDLDLTQDELFNVDVVANEMLTGKAKVDVGCSIIDSNVSMDDLKNLISGNTGTTNPVTIGKNFGGLIDNSFGKNPAQVDPVNKNAIRDGFFKRIINTIKQIIIESVTAAPQIRVLLAIVGGLKNNDDVSGSLTSPTDDIKKQKNLIKCLSDTAESTLNEFIFNLVKAELIKLIVPVATLILQEKIKAFINILKSLV